MNNILHFLPWIWTVITVLCIIIEAITFSLTTVWFAIGAFVMIFLSLLPIPFVVQILIFTIISLGLLIFTRPIVLKFLKVKGVKTNVDGIIGKSVEVTKDILHNQKGEVKIEGLFWSAKSEDNSEIKVGEECRIIRVEGNTVIVKKDIGNVSTETFAEK